MPLSFPLALIPHPTTSRLYHPGPRVELRFLPEGPLDLRYELKGDPGAWRIPPARPAARRDGLWRHTCWELFVAGADTPAYREFNFSPSGEWQAYAFRNYRDGGPLEPAVAPILSLDRGPDRLALSVTLPVANLPPGPRLRIGLTAVLEDADGLISYWALRHAPGQPDFHHPDTFALEFDLREPMP